MPKSAGFSLPLTFDKQIIFPYIFLDEIYAKYGEQYDDCNIYMLMLQDKLEMIKVIPKSNCVIIKYKNISTGKVEKISMYYRDLLGMDIPTKFITVDIEKFGEILKVEIQKEIFEVIKFGLRLPSNMSNIFVWNIYDLITFSKKDEETQECYDVVYIGQSNPKAEYRTIFDRLKKHEKVAEVLYQVNNSHLE